MVALPRGHKLEAEKLITKAMLRDETLIGYMRAPENMHSEPVRVMVGSVDHVPRISHYAENGVAVIGLVSIGAGVSLVSDCFAGLHSTEVSYRPFAEKSAFSKLVFAVSKSTPRASIDILRNCAKSITSGE